MTGKQSRIEPLSTAQLTEIRWMKAALEQRDLNVLTFRAYLLLLSGWKDRQLLALAKTIYPDRRFRGRVDAMRAINKLHHERLVSRLLEEVPFGEDLPLSTASR